MTNHPSAWPIMTDEQHAKLQKLNALCNLCKYQGNCSRMIRDQLCPEISGDLDAYVLPEDCISFDHRATKAATQEIYLHLKAIRELMLLVCPEDPYLSMCILSEDSNLPGRIMFNNTHWELPEEKQINFHENVDDVPIPTNLQAVIRDSRR